MDNVSRLYRMLNKQKKIIKISHDSRGLILPHPWLRTLNWDKGTEIQLIFDLPNKQIVLREATQNEKTSKPEPPKHIDSEVVELPDLQ
jgi:hypothetical protein